MAEGKKGGRKEGRKEVGTEDKGNEERGSGGMEDAFRLDQGDEADDVT